MLLSLKAEKDRDVEGVVLIPDPDEENKSQDNNAVSVRYSGITGPFYPLIILFIHFCLCIDAVFLC